MAAVRALRYLLVAGALGLPACSSIASQQDSTPTTAAVAKVIEKTAKDDAARAELNRRNAQALQAVMRERAAQAERRTAERRAAIDAAHAPSTTVAGP